MAGFIRTLHLSNGEYEAESGGCLFTESGQLPPLCK